MGERAPNLNITALSRALNKRPPTIHAYIRGSRKWPAAEWLRTLMVIGAVEEGPDAFVVTLPRTPELCHAFDRLRGKPHLRQKPQDDPEYVAAPPLPLEYEEFIDGVDE